MTKSTLIRNCAATLLASALMSLVVFAQQQTPTLSSQTQSKVEKPLIPLKVQVTLSRYDGEKKTSSLPFTLWVNANDEQPTNLTMGMQVAFPTTELGPGGAVSSYQYRSVGTTLTAKASALDDGRFRLQLSINDSSISPSKDPKGMVGFQSLQTQNYLLLKDGQTAQFIAATDKVSGEVTKVDVTVSVIK